MSEPIGTKPGGADGDQVRVTVLVAVDPEVAFKVFTEEIDQWWRRGVKFRVSGKRPGIMRIEPRRADRSFVSAAILRRTLAMDLPQYPFGTLPKLTRTLDK